MASSLLKSHPWLFITLGIKSQSLYTNKGWYNLALPKPLLWPFYPFLTNLYAHPTMHQALPYWSLYIWFLFLERSFSMPSFGQFLFIIHFPSLNIIPSRNSTYDFPRVSWIFILGTLLNNNSYFFI